MKPSSLAISALALSAAAISGAQEFPGAASYSMVDRAALSAVAAANAPMPAPDQLTALNAAVVETLKPFNNAQTRATLTFSKAATNAKRAVEVALSLDYAKKGPAGEAGLKLENLSYSYPEAAAAKPVTRLAGSVSLNLLSVVSQQQINAFGAQAQQLVSEFVTDKTRQYGAAAAVAARVTRQEHDAQGNLTALGVTLDLDLDLAQLPATVKPKSVLITGLHAKADVTLKGVSFDVTVVSNPAASQFESDQLGLKEGLNKLLARDPEILAGLSQAVSTIDRAAELFTQGQAH